MIKKFKFSDYTEILDQLKIDLEEIPKDPEVRKRGRYLYKILSQPQLN